MTSYTSEDIQKISAEFRGIAQRLERTDYAQSDANLKRFMKVIRKYPLISEFIDAHNTTSYDIQSILDEREWLDPFDISDDMDEEISLEVQLLEYAVDNFNGNFSGLYGYTNYTGVKTTYEDEMRKFSNHVISPLIDYINDHLRYSYDLAIKTEGGNMNSQFQTGSINAPHSTIVMGSTINGSVTTQANITTNQQADLTALFQEMRELLATTTVDGKDEIVDLLEDIAADVKEGKKPRKSIGGAFVKLCSGLGSLAGLATKIMDLIEQLPNG